MRLFKRKKNNIWYVEIKRGLWRSLKTRDQREAKIFFKELQREALRGKLLILERHPSISAEEFFKEYLSWAETNHAYNTYERTKGSQKNFLHLQELTNLLAP